MTSRYSNYGYGRQHRRPGDYQQMQYLEDQYSQYAMAEEEQRGRQQRGRARRSGYNQGYDNPMEHRARDMDYMGMGYDDGMGYGPGSNPYDSMGYEPRRALGEGPSRRRQRRGGLGGHEDEYARTYRQGYGAEMMAKQAMMEEAMMAGGYGGPASGYGYPPGYGGDPGMMEAMMAEEAAMAQGYGDHESGYRYGPPPRSGRRGRRGVREGFGNAPLRYEEYGSASGGHGRR